MFVSRTEPPACLVTRGLQVKNVLKLLNSLLVFTRAGDGSLQAKEKTISFVSDEKKEEFRREMEELLRKLAQSQAQERQEPGKGRDTDRNILMTRAAGTNPLQSSH